MFISIISFVKQETNMKNLRECLGKFTPQHYAHLPVKIVHCVFRTAVKTTLLFKVYLQTATDCAVSGRFCMQDSFLCEHPLKNNSIVQLLKMRIDPCILHSVPFGCAPSSCS